MIPADNNFVSVNLMLKATPSEDGGDRIIYCEASNETSDLQGEVVLQKALAESMEYMLARGNFDIDHITMIGAKAGIPDYILYEIGRPQEINFRDGRTFVKGVIYRGEGKAAERANYFWSSLTEISPPAQWFPSVGGSVLERDVNIDPLTKARKVAVSKVRWSNIGYSKQPINQTVAAVQTVPMDVFAKSMAASDQLDLGKALTASAATDATALTGGGALGQQSLDRKIYTYWDFRDHTARALRRRKVRGGSKAIHAYAVAQGIPDDEAAEWTERFIGDLKSNLKRLKA